MPTTKSGPTSPESPERKTFILEWFATHPVVGLIGSIASVLGVLFAGWSYLSTLRTRELTFYVNPAKTTIVKSGQSSDLHVLYKGQSVSTDVTALQIEVWSAGKEVIRPEHVLDPVVLVTTPKVPILEAQIRQISRSITRVSLDSAEIADGRVGLSWKILEQNDAAVIQLIVAGSSATTVTVNGALEGQAKIGSLDSTKIRSLSLFILRLALFFLILCAYRFVEAAVLRIRSTRTRKVVGELSLLTIFVFGIFVLAFRTHTPLPVPLPFN